MKSDLPMRSVTEWYSWIKVASSNRDRRLSSCTRRPRNEQSVSSVAFPTDAVELAPIPPRLADHRS